MHVYKVVLEVESDDDDNERVREAIEAALKAGEIRARVLALAAARGSDT